MVRPNRSIYANARIARGWSIGFSIAGIAALGAGLLIGGIVAVATATPAGLSVAAVVAGAGIATGGLSLWESRRFSQRAELLQSTISEHRLFALAEARGGILRVVDVARELTVMSEEAEALLDGLVDELRVSMQVTDEGEIQYVFRELHEMPGPRARVQDARAQVSEEGPVHSLDSEHELKDRKQ
jgi:hypothetical protein